MSRPTGGAGDRRGGGREGGEGLAGGAGHPRASPFLHRVSPRQANLPQQTLARHEVHLR